jgi:hypothetical protein
MRCSAQQLRSFDVGAAVATQWAVTPFLFIDLVASFAPSLGHVGVGFKWELRLVAVLHDHCD